MSFMKATKLGLAAAALLSSAATIAGAEVLFWSQQGGKVEEAQAIRENVLPGASVEIDFQSPEPDAISAS